MSNTKHIKPQGPQLIGKGTYAIYESPDGDGVIAYRPEGREKDTHQVIPKSIWSLVMQAMRGEKISANPMEIIKALMGSLK